MATDVKEETPRRGYEGRQKIGARIDVELKRRLKIASAIHDRTEESIVVEAISEWLDRHNAD